MRLLQQGYRVRTTLRDLSKERSVRAAIATKADADERLRFVVADLMQDDGWEAAMAGIDYVLHVASPLSGEQTSADRYALVPPGIWRRCVHLSAEFGGLECRSDGKQRDRADDQGTVGAGHHRHGQEIRDPTQPEQPTDQHDRTHHQRKQRGHRHMVR